MSDKIMMKRNKIKNEFNILFDFLIMYVCSSFTFIY